MVTKEKVKYLSSPKEASGNAEAAFSGASAFSFIHNLLFSLAP
jgi:hypothetical protein